MINPIKSARTLGLAGLIVAVAMVIVASVGVASASAQLPAGARCAPVFPAGALTGRWEEATCKKSVTRGEYMKVFGGRRLVNGATCALVRIPKTGVYEDSLCTTAGGTEEYIEVFPANRNFKGASPNTSVLETKKAGIVARKVECKEEASEGEVNEENSRLSEKITVKFKGCKGPLSSTCTSSGAGSGEIVTKDLKGKFVYLDESTKTVGQELEPEAAGGEFAAFECAGALIKETLKVKGTLLGEIPSSELNEMRSTFEVSFKQSKGTESPTEYEEGSKKIKTELETEGKGTETFAYEESGQETKETITPEEEAEIAA